MQSCCVVEIQRTRQCRIFEFLQRFVVMLRLRRGLGHALGVGVDGPALLGDLGEVAHPRAGDQHRGARFLQGGVDARRPITPPCRSAFRRDRFSRNACRG
jgi:hypothetical protein